MTTQSLIITKIKIRILLRIPSDFHFDKLDLEIHAFIYEMIRQPHHSRLKKNKILWPLSVARVQLSKGCKATTRRKFVF